MRASRCEAGSKAVNEREWVAIMTAIFPGASPMYKPVHNYDKKLKVQSTVTSDESALLLRCPVVITNHRFYCNYGLYSNYRFYCNIKEQINLY